MSRARTRSRLRRWGRRLFVASSVALLGGAMAASVERGSEARRLSEEIGRLERREAVARARLAEAMRRVDSLTSRARIARAAGRLGLRPASDEDITFLQEAPTSRKGGDGDR